MSEGTNELVPVVLDAEVIAPPAPRDPLGKFAPGTTVSRKGSLNKVSRLMQQELATYLESKGANGNPLVILATIAADESHPVIVRVQAADRLARYLAPRLMSVEIEQPDSTFEIQTEQIRQTIRGLFTGGGGNK